MRNSLLGPVGPNITTIDLQHPQAVGLIVPHKSRYELRYLQQIQGSPQILAARELTLEYRSV